MIWYLVPVEYALMIFSWQVNFSCSSTILGSNYPFPHQLFFFFVAKLVIKTILSETFIFRGWMLHARVHVTMHVSERTSLHHH
jgi:hypothetical protein